MTDTRVRDELTNLILEWRNNSIDTVIALNTRERLASFTTRNADALLAALRLAESHPSAIKRGQAEYHGMEFDDAANIVETLLARYPERPPENIYQAFRMVFGDPAPDPSAIREAVEVEREACAKIAERFAEQNRQQAIESKRRANKLNGLGGEMAETLAESAEIASMECDAAFHEADAIAAAIRARGEEKGNG